MLSLKERLSEILIKNKLITEPQLNEALQVQKEKGGRLSDVIVGLKFVKERDLIPVISESLSLPLIDLKKISIDPEVIKLIPFEVASHYQIIPVSMMGTTITLAMADPLNIFAVDHVEAFTGYKINTVIASTKDVLEAIELSYPDASLKAVDKLLKEMAGHSTIELIEEGRRPEPSDQELKQIGHSSAVIKITDMLLGEALSRRASDILIEPQEESLRIRFRIDGVLKEAEAPPQSMHPAIVSRIKVLSDLNIAEHRVPQDGRFKSKIKKREVDFRVSILPSSFGEKVAIRILDKSQATLDIEKLGFNPQTVVKLKKTAGLPHGLLLVCGPTGSGKTTTLYSILKFVDTPQKNIVTVEDPVEYQLEGVNQVTASPQIGLTFAAALRSILRQDPNVIMVGEIRDYETVDIAIKSALTGHLVLSTLHTNTASGAIVRLINMGVDPYLINASLLCIVAQRLVRKVCDYCKESYQLKKEVVDNLRLNLASLKKLEFLRGRGCTKCLNTGYSGRVGIAEVLLLSPKIKELISSRSQEHPIKVQAHKEGMLTLREDGLRAVAGGLTSIEEVLRVTEADE